ncbi:MAG TPA: hypothetical protein VGF67_19440 [Ktedonobacteraceae bacterium]
MSLLCSNRLIECSPELCDLATKGITAAAPALSLCNEHRIPAGRAVHYPCAYAEQPNQPQTSPGAINAPPSTFRIGSPTAFRETHIASSTDECPQGNWRCK